MVCSLYTLTARAENTIIIVGDSISAAYGMQIKQGWVTLLQKRLKKEKYDYRVINLSVSGHTTSNGLTLLPNALKKYKPQVTIIELGANDGLRGLSLDNIKKNLTQMIEMAKLANSKVLLVGIRLPPNFGPVYTKQFQEIFIHLAKEKGISVVPLLLNQVDEDGALFQADGVHPNAKAQVIILNNVWPVLKSLL